MKSGYRYHNCIYREWLFMTLMVCMITAKTKAQVSIEMTTGMITEINGMITVVTDGGWLNQGNLLPGESTILLGGPYAQSLVQQGGSFHHLTVNKANGEVLIASDIVVENGTLTIQQQDLLLNGFMITLDPTATLSEQPGQTVKGPVGMITTTRNVNFPSQLNVAGMGLEMTADVDLGLTIVSRGHAAQVSNGAQSILRYFDVIPQHVHDFDFLTFYYDESELNGNDEAGLQLFRSPDGGLNWMAVEGILDSEANKVLVGNVSSASRFTLSSHCLETCIATEAITHSATIYLNAAGLALLIPQDVNQNSKGACGIDTMWVYPEVFSCAHIGQQEVVLTVVDNNGCSRSATASVDVMDQVDPEMHCKTFTLYLDESCNGTLYPMDIDDGSFDACGLNLTINASAFDCGDIGLNQVVLSGIDPSGNEAHCTTTVEVLMELPEVVCQDAFINIALQGEVVIDPFDLISGDPEDYVGYEFEVEPDILYCNELGEHVVSLTITDPFGIISTCEVTVHLAGPDEDCDQVADACDMCHGGDDQLDADNDGIPDCADWDGWNNLVEEWQCAANKVFICHEGNVICVNQNAVQAHLDHGDFLGSCSAVYCENDPLQVSPGAYFVEILHEGEILDHVVKSTQGEISDPSDEKVILENYPNPFYPSSTIRFYLPGNDQVLLTVFDIHGKRVTELMNGYAEKGWHEVVFIGNQHVDGMYCYQLQLSHRQFTKIMILTRK